MSAEKAINHNFVSASVCQVGGSNPDAVSMAMALLTEINNFPYNRAADNSVVLPVAGKVASSARGGSYGIA